MRPRRASLAAADAAVAPVIAAVAFLMVSAVGAATVHVAVGKFSAEGEAPPAVAFTAKAAGCHSIVKVASGSGGDWRDLRVAVAGAGAYGVDAAGLFADSAEWRGSGLGARDPVAAGDTVRLAVADPVTSVDVSVVHGPSKTTLLSREVPVRQHDDAAPTGASSLSEGATVSDLGAVTGTANDACSGVGEVRVEVVRLSDGHYLTASGFSPAAHAFTARGTSWSVDLDESLLTAGDYRVTTTAVDAAGNAGAAHVANVTYDPAAGAGGGGGGGAAPPTASFTYACVGLTCDFDAAGSSGGDGAVASYAWDFGDGATATGATPSHAYAAGGDYAVRLTVTNAGGSDDAETQSLTAVAPAFDPGHAYEDVDNDRLYTAGLDVAIADAEVLDGVHAVAAAGHGLVIPASVGDVAVGGKVQFRTASGGHLTVAVDVSAGAMLQLTSGGDAFVEGVTVGAPSEKVEVRADGALRGAGLTVTDGKHVILRGGALVALNGSSVTSETNKVDVKADGAGAALFLRDAVVRGEDKVLIRSNGTVDLAGAAVESERKQVDVVAGGDVDATGARLAASKGLTATLGAAGDTLTVAGATIEDKDDALAAGPRCVNVAGAPAAGAVDNGC